ncbi:MAG: hypothetical protein ACT4OQ_11345 [Chloroflexota bacterium]
MNIGHRIQVAVECECGTTVGASDEAELFDEFSSTSPSRTNR